MTHLIAPNLPVLHTGKRFLKRTFAIVPKQYPTEKKRALKTSGTTSFRESIGYKIYNFDSRNIWDKNSHLKANFLCNLVQKTALKIQRKKKVYDIFPKQQTDISIISSDTLSLAELLCIIKIHPAKNVRVCSKKRTDFMINI